MGMGVASFIVLPHLWSDRRDAAGAIIFPTLTEAEKSGIRLHDLVVIRDPYVAIGLVVLIMLVVFALTRMPRTESTGEHARVGDTMRRLLDNKPYMAGVVTQMFYVAAQIMVWTFIIQYADRLGINKATAQTYNIVAMVLFLSGRFISTFLMRYVNTRLLLAIFATGAALCTLGTIFIQDIVGLYSLVGISVFMSLMFPTIYGIALENVNAEDASLGAAFLVMAIVGGAIMPPLQGMIIDRGVVMGLPAVNASFVLPLISFAVVFTYGFCQYQLSRKHGGV